ncbi:VOC family protein [Herbidospora cretacea]|uniref:VOC family protein n=1 Tax=Herbidospora cretacea TaxID=28444 RepID=UPI000A87992F|nr:VOC family protein [Herbidospora cretacea]
MTIRRMDHVSIVVDDLAAGVGFFTRLGMQVEGSAPIEGPSVDALNGIDGLRAEITMLRTPDGHGRVELTRFHAPAAFSQGDQARPNALGLRSIMFQVDDLDETLARLGADLVGEVVHYEDAYRLAYVRGPEGVIVALAQQLDS